jgi:hypothetical protein
MRKLKSAFNPYQDLNVLVQNFVKTAVVKKLLLMILILASAQLVSAQKVDSIYFHLYTDSLKKGFYNYINIDGKMTDGTWLPLDSNHIRLTCNTGYFRGNDLFLDSSYKADFVTVRASLRNNPSVWKEVTIYIRKRGFDEPLKTNQEILDEYRNRATKPKRNGN